MAKTRILVVEDEAVTAMDIQARLTKLSYDVVGTAFSGEEALAAAAKLKPNLILMDIVLQGKIDGTEAAKIISSQYNIPVIFLTAYSDEDTFNRALLSIPYGYITKPFETRDLKIAVELALYKRNMEMKLAASEKRHTILMENASCGFFICDINGVVSEVNQKCETIFGVKKDSIINRDFRQFIPASELEYASVQLKKLAIEKHIGPNEGHIQQPNGSIRDVEFASVCIESGDDTLYLSTLNDVTERNSLRSKAVLNDKLSLVGTIASGIIHEINNPMNWILSNLTFMKDKLNILSPIDTKQQHLIHEFDDMINESIKGAEQIRHIVRYLKCFTVQETKNLDPIDIHVEINSAIKIASSALNDVVLEKNFLANIPELIFGNTLLQQVMLNLIINAAQAFTSNKQKDNKIVITTSMENQYVRIDVMDNGNGIAPEVLPHIFEPFFTTKSAGVGTGLGLSICLDIIHKLCGDIKVKSVQGAGTTFTIYLPVELKIHPAAQIETSVQPKKRLSILIIDDSPMLLKSLKRLLIDHHNTTEVLGGRAAIDLLAMHKNEFDVIISDLNMPDVNGADVYRYIVEKYPGLERKFIFTTGGSFSPGLETFLADNTNPRLQKPFTSQELLELISHVCN